MLVEMIRNNDCEEHFRDTCCDAVQIIVSFYILIFWETEYDLNYQQNSFIEIYKADVLVMALIYKYLSNYAS